MTPLTIITNTCAPPPLSFLFTPSFHILNPLTISSYIPLTILSPFPTRLCFPSTQPYEATSHSPHSHDFPSTFLITLYFLFHDRLLLHHLFFSPLSLNISFHLITRSPHMHPLTYSPSHPLTHLPVQVLTHPSLLRSRQKKGSDLRSARP